MPNDFNRHKADLDDRVRAGEITQEEANNTMATVAGMKLGVIASAVAMGVLCPGVGTVAGVAMLVGGGVGGAKLGHELSKPKR